MRNYNLSSKMKKLIKDLEKVIEKYVPSNYEDDAKSEVRILIRNHYALGEKSDE